MSDRRTLLAAGLVGLPTMLLGSQASAFAPSARWLIRRAMYFQLQRKIRSLKASFELVRYDLDGYPKGFRTNRRVTLVCPHLIRRETDMPTGVLLEVQNNKQSLLEIPKKGVQIKKARPTVWDLWTTTGDPLTATEAGDRLAAALEKRQVDIDVVSFSRFDGRVSYVIGAKPWETDKPQMWLDKETFHLTRFSHRGADGQRREQRFLGWGSAEGGAWMPKTIETLRGEKLIERASLLDVDRNDPVDKALFEVKK